MPSHEEDLQFISEFQQIIIQQTTNHPNHTILLGWELNRDISLSWKHHNNTLTTPQAKDVVWKTYSENLYFTYIPTTTSFTRQGGENYSHTSLIDAFYIHTTNNQLYTSTTETTLEPNSNHFPICLTTPENTLLVKTMPFQDTPKPQILNPIPPQNIENFNNYFLERNTIQIDT
jgi:hypothetical protein